MFHRVFSKHPCCLILQKYENTSQKLRNNREKYALKPFIYDFLYLFQGFTSGYFFADFAV